MQYSEMKPLHGPNCGPEDPEDALEFSTIAELDGQAAARHGVPAELNPYDGIYADLWEKGRQYVFGNLPFQN